MRCARLAVGITLTACVVFTMVQSMLIPRVRRRPVSGIALALVGILVRRPLRTTAEPSCRRFMQQHAAQVDEETQPARQRSTGVEHPIGAKVIRLARCAPVRPTTYGMVLP